MGEWVDIPLTADFADASATAADNVPRFQFATEADLQNLMLIESPHGAPRPFQIVTTPGMEPLANQPGGSGDIRGICIRADGKVFVIRGTAVYYSSGGAWTQVPSGSMPGTAQCRMVDADAYVVAVDGTNAVTITTSAVTACSRGNFSDVTYQDGFTVYTETGTNSVYCSNVDNPGTIDPLRFTTADALAGDCVGLISDTREIVVFKTHSAELYFNEGLANFPFGRSTPGIIERGCYSAYTIAKYGTSIYWVGDDKRVYALNGQTPTPISNPWVELQLSGVGTSTQINGSTFCHEGVAYYSLNWNSSTTSYGLVYDIKRGLWHRRTPIQAADIYFVVGFIEINNTGNREVWAAANGPNGPTNKVYALRSYLGTDNSQAPTRILTLPMYDPGSGGRVFMHEFRLESSLLDAAYGFLTGSEAVTLTWDDHNAASGANNFTFPGQSASPFNRRLSWQRLGAFFQRTLRVTFTAIAQPFAVQSARARISMGAA